MTEYLYVICRRDGVRKVGRSRDPLQRVSQLYSQVPPALADSLALEHQAECPAEHVAQAEAHAQFLLHAFRHSGEWFEVDDRTARQAVDIAAAIAARGGRFPKAPIKRTTLLIPDSLYRRVVDYRFRNRHKNVNDAILDLIKAGLAEVKAH